ncbi:hypothetical protein [Sphingobium sp. Sx8-8]|uniref:hypothetical protein n=1 Tax=Sphingobium sp. Sx8-8 TaxID=2933617 RepID=UPI001F56E8D5|nr:hypothetical protein [Sphingobium sp. Sx8-8]
MKAGGWLCALICALAPQGASARQDIRLDRQMFVERVSTDINGRVRRVLESADRAGSGDQLIFVVNWRNEGSRPVRGLAVTNAVPRGTQIDLSDPAMQLSVDGGAHWGRLTDLWLPTALGGTRRAVPADITHVRWTVPQAISPGESGRLSYRATVR